MEAVKARGLDQSISVREAVIDLVLYFTATRQRNTTQMEHTTLRANSQQPQPTTNDSRSASTSFIVRNTQKSKQPFLAYLFSLAFYTNESHFVSGTIT
jgi:hypothetical protein